MGTEASPGGPVFWPRQRGEQWAIYQDWGKLVEDQVLMGADGNQEVCFGHVDLWMPIRHSTGDVK